MGQQSDGNNLTSLWTLTSGGNGFANPVKKWDNDDRTTGSWSWDRSKPVTGDFNGDGKTDVGILYDYGQQTGGTNRTGLWRITSTGTGFDVPALAWDSNNR
ncbi:hypothetical protein ACFWHQ_32260 [Streptomyces sp. NPDC060334]|uniref:hypothetical protein n=1 Tax=Streptomyces sp. NPDC060334 TaxID=3347099 RepID=UPI0036597112